MSYTMPACTVCNIHLNSPEQLQQHLAGKVHAKKVKAAAKSETTIAEASATNDAASQPTAGSGVDGVQTISSGTVECALSSTDQTFLKPQIPSDKFCDVCKAVLNSPDQAQQHYQGSRHAKRLKLMTNGPSNAPQTGATSGDSATASADLHHGFFFCSFCNVYVNSVQQMTIHRQGARHKKMVEARKRAAEQPSPDMETPKKTPKMDSGQTSAGSGQNFAGGRGQNSASGRGHNFAHGRGQNFPSEREQTFAGGRGENVGGRGHSFSRGRGQNFTSGRGQIFAAGRGQNAGGRGYPFFGENVEGEERAFSGTPSESLTVAGILNSLRSGSQSQERRSTTPPRQTEQNFSSGTGHSYGGERGHTFGGGRLQNVEQEKLFTGSPSESLTVGGILNTLRTDSQLQDRPPANFMRQMGQTFRSGRGQNVEERERKFTGSPSESLTVGGILNTLRTDNQLQNRPTNPMRQTGQNSASGRGQNVEKREAYAGTPSQSLTVAGILNSIRTDSQLQERPRSNSVGQRQGGYESSYENEDYNGQGVYDRHDGHSGSTNKMASFVGGGQVS